MQKRLPGVDGLRGLAILMVTGFHLWLALGRIQVSVGPLHATPLLAYGAAGVGLFFVISGYSLYSPVAAGRWRGTQAFYRRRAVRLLPAYYLALLLWLPWWITFKGGWQESGALTQLLTHMTFTHSFSPTTFGGIRGVFWFMGTLGHFVLLFPLLAWAMRRAPLPTFIVGFALSNLLRWGVDHYAYPQFWLSMSLPCRLGEFLAGMYAAHLAQHSKRSWLVWPLGGTALLAAPYLHSAIHPLQAPGVWWWGDTLFAPLWGGLVLLAVWYAPPLLTSRPLVYAGLFSYGAFLYNPLVYYAIHLAKAGTLSWWFLGIAMPICAGAINLRMRTRQ